jgi:ZIP family zinc transporter
MAATWQQGITPVAALVFAIGLALQNLPEGMAVVVPLKETGMSKKRIMRFGTLASFAEPAAALVGIALSLALTSLGHYVMPIMLTVAAGAMVFITVEELIPASQEGAHGGHGATYGFLLGFWVMAVMGILAG